MSTPSPRYVFVVTYGRSGSTLTQGMLNAMPRTLVRGENNMYLLQLFRAYQGLKTFKDKFAGAGAAKPTSAFYGLRETDLDAFAASVRELVERQLLGSTPASEVDRLGFKEVLWHRIKRQEWSDFFDFVDTAFDQPNYVLNRRDVAMASTSGFWRKKEPGVAEQQINRVRRLQDFLRESRPERCFDTQFEVMTGEDHDAAADLLRRLGQFVTGSCDDGLLSALMATRETPHGPNPMGKARDDVGG